MYPIVRSIAKAFLTIAVMLAAGTPVAAKPDAKKGQDLFDRLTCSMCHPGGGNVLNPKKPLKGAEFRKAFPSDDDIAKLIRKGVPGTSMDAFRKDKLSDEELLHVIAFIRSLPQPDASAKAEVVGGNSKKQPAPVSKSKGIDQSAAGAKPNSKPSAKSSVKPGSQKKSSRS